MTVVFFVHGTVLFSSSRRVKFVSSVQYTVAAVPLVPSSSSPSAVPPSLPTVPVVEEAEEEEVEPELEEEVDEARDIHNGPRASEKRSSSSSSSGRENVVFPCHSKGYINCFLSCFSFSPFFFLLFFFKKK